MADRLMTVVSAPSLTDAARTASRELKLWLEHEWGLTNGEAAMVMGIGAHCGIGQVSNLLHTAKWFPSTGRCCRPDGADRVRSNRTSTAMSESDAMAAGPTTQTWHGVLVANPVILDSDLEVDFDGYSDHIAWLADSGFAGITPNGSLGEYQSLTREERERAVTTAIEVAPEGFAVISAVSAYSAGEAVSWTEHAAEAGADAVMALPPNSYRADERSVVEHFRAVAKVGLPIIAYNNPIDTKVDLTPSCLPTVRRGV